jgi:iron complex transport system substrate-binding protein
MRIASLQPSVSLTIQRLGRLDALCAVTRYCLEAVPELAAINLPILEDSWSFDKPHHIDQLLATRPDLVIASVPYRMESLAAILKAGVPLLTLAPHALVDIYGDIQLIASQLDAQPSAQSLIETMQTSLETVRISTQSLQPQLVYCEEWGKPLIHSQPWVAELIAAANGTFVGIPGAHTTPETIAAEDPDVLLFAWCGAGDRVPLERVIAQRGWQNLRAVRERRVFCIPDEYLNTPAPGLIKGLHAIAGALHPEVFPPHPRVRRIAG